MSGEEPDRAVPGVGFVTVPELSWRRFDDASEVVRIGQRVTGEFLQFDTSNGEARLSLRAMRPDPFQEFARGHRVGQVLDGTVTVLVPFGAFVRVADGVEGLLRPPDEAVRLGERVTVVITGLDLEGRRLTLSR
ncbi:S1 RNA-binding domain-containing protein [Spirillospora sp. CA-255316]